MATFSFLLHAASLCCPLLIPSLLPLLETFGHVEIPGFLVLEASLDEIVFHWSLVVSNCLLPQEDITVMMLLFFCLVSPLHLRAWSFTHLTV